jgi:ubiquinone/menaquinone biosynthesis C-methylase UbiE
VEGTDLRAHEIRNATWSLADVRAQYSDGNEHADLYRFIGRWTDLDTYLNVGFSRWWHIHMHTTNHLRLIDRLARRLLRVHSHSEFPEERRLLDVACGRGGAALRAAQRFGLSVLGVDITPENVCKAIANAERQGLHDRVRFIEGDAHALPIEDGTYPMVWSIESPAHFSDKRAFLEEVRRILKPGGAFALADLLVVDDVVAVSPRNRAIYRDFLQTWDLPYLESFDTYRVALKEAGFELLDAEIITRHNLKIYRRYCWLFLALSQIPWLYKRYRRVLKRKTGANLDNVYQHTLRSYRALRLDMIDYGLFWAVKR